MADVVLCDVFVFSEFHLLCLRCVVLVVPNFLCVLDQRWFFDEVFVVKGKQKRFANELIIF